MLGKNFDVQVDEEWQQDYNCITVTFKFVSISSRYDQFNLLLQEKQIAFCTTSNHIIKEYTLYDTILPTQTKTKWIGNKLQVNLYKAYFSSHWETPLYDTTVLDNKHRINGNVVASTEDVIELTHLRNDWRESAVDPELMVTVFIRKIIENDFRIDTGPQKLRITFRTRDTTFLRTHSGSSETTLFKWSINLRDTITPTHSTYEYVDGVLHIKLRKERVRLWHDLEEFDLDNNARQDKVATITLTAPLSFIEDSLDDYGVATNIELLHDNIDLYHDGMTGLNNLGNTCFMNSILQSLSNSRPLRDYFIEGDIKKDVNYDNPLGSKGSIAVSFAVLIRALWSGKHHAYTPTKLKSFVAAKATQFMGFAQQDAQEFMAYLLDGLHEDLNRVKQKPLTQAIEGTGRPDEEVAKESWLIHQKRNDSIIVDYFHGQLKSVLTCPTCHKTSTTFDPFMILPLPIPEAKIPITVVAVVKNPAFMCAQKTFMIRKRANVKALQKAISLWLHDLLPEDIRLLILLNENRCQMLEDRDLVSYLSRYDIVYACECTSDYDVDDNKEHFVKPVIQRVICPEFPAGCSGCYKECSSTRLKRCTKCYAVAYCDRGCQRQHWDYHKRNCGIIPTPIGLPFLLVIPKSEASIPNLFQEAFKMATQSVSVTRNEVEITSLTDNSLIMPDLAPFSLTPVTNRFGLKETDFCKDHEDDEIVNLDDVVQFFMDWDNKPNKDGSLVVQNREIVADDPDENRDFARDTRLQDCLKLFTLPEILSPEEAWYCPTCKEHREAQKQLSLWRLPPILVIQLKRFSVRNLLFRDKISTHIEFPENGLDLREYLSNSLNGKTDDSCIYDLYAVVNHYGELMGGHYTTYARFPTNYNNHSFTRWRLYDDSRVEYTTKNVVTRSAYLLFYQKREMVSM